MIRRISVVRRIDLARRLLEVAPRLQFEAAGDSAESSLRAMELTSELTRAYVEWGLERVEGLWIDGERATPRLLLERGPEDLCAEAALAIRRECGLDEEERKN